MVQAGEELIPSGVRWPNETDYLIGLADGLGSVSDLVSIPVIEGGLLSDPVRTQIAGLRATVEGASGMSLGGLAGAGSGVIALIGAERASDTLAAVGQILDGTLEIVSTAVQAAGVAANTLKMIPLIGSFIGGLIDGAVEAFRQAELEARLGQVRDAICQVQVYRQAGSWCSEQIAKVRPQPTGEGGRVTVSDLFRPLAYVIQGKTARMPVSIASIYAAMCGPAARDELGDIHYGIHNWDHPGGIRINTESGWNQCVSIYRSWSGDDHIGIPLSIQRRRWSLIKGILGAVRRPELGYVTDLPLSINGQEMFPALNDLVLSLWRSGSDEGASGPKRSGYGVSADFFRYLSNWISDSYKPMDACYTSAGGVIEMPPCTGFGVNLGPARYSLLVQHELAISLAADQAKRELTIVRPVKGVLVLGDKESEQLLEAERSAERLQAQRRRRLAIALTTSVIAGGGALMIARNLRRGWRG
jgi:hypothetical protein